MTHTQTLQLTADSRQCAKDNDLAWRVMECRRRMLAAETTEERTHWRNLGRRLWAELNGGK